MGIRVPTGFKELQLTAQRKGFIRYRCTKCGNVQLGEMNIKTTSTAQYHVLGGEKARIEAENYAHKIASDNLVRLDNERFNAINVQHDYSKISEPVICPDCGEKQIWSTIMPKPLSDSQTRGDWIIGIFFSGMISFATLVFAGYFCLIPLSLFIYLLSLPLLRLRKRKKTLKILEEASFQPPMYYNHSNINELLNQKRV